MFKNIKLGAKMAVGFGLTIAMGAIISFAGWLNLTTIQGDVRIADNAAYIANLSLQRDRLVREFMLTRDEKSTREEIKKIESGFQKAFSGMREMIRDKNTLQDLKNMEDLDKHFGQAFFGYIELDNKNRAIQDTWEKATARITVQMDELMQKVITPAVALAKKSYDYIALQEWGDIDSAAKQNLIEPFLKTRIASIYYMNGRTDPLWQTLSKEMTALEKQQKKWMEVVEHQGKKALKERADRLKAGIGDFIARAGEFRENVTAQAKQKTVLVLAARNLQDMSKGMSDKKMTEMKTITSRTVTLLFSLAIAGVLIGVLIATFITRSISRPIKRIIRGLGDSAVQVDTASNQVSYSSRALAEGATEQASSLEETSASLEEMASMTKQNATHADEADHLMKEASRMVSQADNAMDGLAESMSEISEASKEISKIIKTIDEIAFQTNLLALNAAVEAARAGEAGAGFAVVADEVRNLAMRAAEAAKNTSELIEGTVKKINDGSESATSANDAFSKVSSSYTKVGELVAEIAAASNEQAQGIDQLNNAVAEMDRVVQQNAASSEASASASEEMNSQATRLKEFVDQLISLAGGAQMETTVNAGQTGTPAGKIYEAEYLPHEQEETALGEPTDGTRPKLLEEGK